MTKFLKIKMDRWGIIRIVLMTRYLTGLHGKRITFDVSSELWGNSEMGHGIDYNTLVKKFRFKSR